MMKKLILLALCTSIMLFFPACKQKNMLNPPSNAPTITSKPQREKVKIVVLTSKGGNGHISACATLQDIFPAYDITLVNPIYDIFHKTFDGEDLYVKIVQDGWIRTASFVAGNIAPTYFNINRKSYRKHFLKYLEKEKPDLLISVIPYINYPAAWAAEKFKIPFMLITLDADLTIWLVGMEHCKKHNFTVTVQTKTPRIVKQLAHKKIPLSCVHEVGCPLRKEFFITKDRKALKKIKDEWKIPHDKKVILLMRGGTGSIKLVDYVKKLVKLDKQLHLLVCIGRNTKLGEKINRIKTTGCVSYSIVPFTPKIPDLMAVSDLLITQPSPNVCNEAIFSKLPILIDMTGPCLFWEKATIDWIKLYGCGDVFKNMRQLKKLVLTSLNKKELLRSQPQKQRLNFNTEIRRLVNRQLSSMEKAKQPQPKKHTL